MAQLKVLVSVYNISGYLMAELAELSKTAEIAVIYTPYEREYAEPRYPQYKWLRRDEVQSVETLEKEIDDFKPDIFLCGGWVDKVCLALVRRLKRNGVRTVLLVDTPWQSRLKQFIHCLYSRFYLTSLFDYAWGAGAPQERYLRYLGFPKKRIRQGYYCADTNKFAPIGEEKLKLKVEVKDRNGSSTVWPHTFLYIGRYVPVKNMRRMERAFLKAIEQMPESDWTLRCIGTGELWDERTIHPRIEHLGWKTEDIIQEFVRDAGCFVLPSIYEPWGVVVHEAALMGLPMLCSDQIQAASKFLKEGENGYVLDPMDEAAMTASFLKVMHTPDELLAKFGEESHRLGMSYTLGDWVVRVKTFVGEV